MEDTTKLVNLTADVVSAFVSNNSIPTSELAGLIGSVHGALTAAASSLVSEPEVPAKPAVPIRRSVQDDAISCLECGKGHKSLKRHLRAGHGLTPQEYRTKWGLTADYPMVAPNYRAARSKMAIKLGLGRLRNR